MSERERERKREGERREVWLHSWREIPAPSSFFLLVPLFPPGLPAGGGREGFRTRAADAKSRAAWLKRREVVAKAAGATFSALERVWSLHLDAPCGQIQSEKSLLFWLHPWSWAPSGHSGPAGRGCSWRGCSWLCGSFAPQIARRKSWRTEKRKPT